jgi:hypothetical protein
MPEHHQHRVSRSIERLRKMSDEQLQALTEDEFWAAIEPDGVCPECDPRLGAEAERRNARRPQ